MTPHLVAWGTADASLRDAIERVLNKPPGASQVLHEGPQRRLLRLDLADDDPDSPPRAVVAKIHRRRRGLRSLRESLKRIVGRSSARREWRALERTHALDLPVPRPLGFGRDGDGAELIITEYVAGDSFLEALTRADPDHRDRLVEALVEAVAALHQAGLVHGDLHAGNLRVRDDAIVLLDLQRLYPTRRPADRMADWARLVCSLERSVAGPSVERALRERAGVGPALDEARLRFLRDYRRGRARRHLRPGGRWQRVRLDARHRGLVDATFDPVALRDTIVGCGETNDSETRRSGRVKLYRRAVAGQALICKEVSAGGILRALADRLRGSAGARAFRLAQADRLISDRSAAALGFVERRVGGLPVTSWLVMEETGRQDLDAFVPVSSEAARGVATALGAWIAEQHARGLGHHDLKAGNVRIDATGDAPRFWLIDLEELVGPTPLTESARIRSLVQLNASLADADFDRASRLAALERYAARLPFERPLAEIASVIAQESAARQHRWRGTDCPALARRRKGMGATRPA